MKTVDHSYEQALIMHDNVHIHVIMNIIVTPYLVATITIPGKLTSLGETSAAEDELIKQNRLMDFKHLLSDPKHSDIVLKCSDTRFLCHKVILASR